jgi:hypothetical protein
MRIKAVMGCWRSRSNDQEGQIVAGFLFPVAAIKQGQIASGFPLSCSGDHRRRSRLGWVVSSYSGDHEGDRGREFF